MADASDQLFQKQQCDTLYYPTIFYTIFSILDVKLYSTNFFCFTWTCSVKFEQLKYQEKSVTQSHDIPERNQK